MGILRKIKKIFSKKPVEETKQYRCPECGKYTEITTCVEYKQLYRCMHCDRIMVICHGKTIGYK